MVSNAECNACYLASTKPAWVAELVVQAREDHPCAVHGG